MQSINFELDGKKYCCKKLNAKEQLKIATRLARGANSLANLDDNDLDYVVGKLLGTVQVQHEPSKNWINVVTNDSPDYELMDETMTLTLLNELAANAMEHNFGDFSEGAPSVSN